MIYILKRRTRRYCENPSMIIPCLRSKPRHIFTSIYALFNHKKKKRLSSRNLSFKALTKTRSKRLPGTLMIHGSSNFRSLAQVMDFLVSIFVQKQRQTTHLNFRIASCRDSRLIHVNNYGKVTNSRSFEEFTRTFFEKTPIHYDFIMF